MADENPPEFRFDGDEQEPETFYHEELKDLRVEKLSQRLTLLTILLPCLIAVAIYFGYQNLSDRVSQSYDTGSLEVQRLTKELEDLSRNFNEKLITFSTTLSTQDKDFGTSIEGRLFAVKKNMDELQNEFKSFGEGLRQDLEQNQDTIEKLKASKADKKSLAVAVEKINAAIKPLQDELQELKSIKKELTTVSGDIKKLESKLTNNLVVLSAKTDQFGKEYEQLAASLAKLSDNAIDKDALALEIFKLKKNFQSQLSGEVVDLNQRLDAIQKQIDGIDKISGTQKQSLNKVSPTTNAQQSGSARSVGSESATLPAQSETITEKNLIE